MSEVSNFFADLISFKGPIGSWEFWVRHRLFVGFLTLSKKYGEEPFLWDWQWFG